MFKQKISIHINSTTDKIKIYDEYWIFLSNLLKNGQILESNEKPFINNNELISYHSTFEKTSLSKKHFDKYTIEKISEIEKMCNSKLRTEVIGRAEPNFRGVCKCKKSESYILFTHAFDFSSALTCVSCNKSLPIYKLKKLTYANRYDLLSWETNYKACDNLQLNCTVGEKWATKQMSDPKSELSKEGIEICQIISQVTKVPVYYYLYNYRHIPHQKDKERLCPSCNKKWLLKERLLDFFDFKCDNCKLLSNFSPVTN